MDGTEPFTMMSGLLSKGNRPVTDLADALQAIAAIFETEKQVHQVDAWKAAYTVSVGMRELGRIGHFDKGVVWFESPDGEYRFEVPI
jgi:hypothetical protein